MSYILQDFRDFYDWYRDAMDNRSDQRLKDWPMMSSPLPTIGACLLYVYLNKVLIPKIMANRKPFELNNTLILYNLLQTVFNAWLFSEFLASGWWGEYSFSCQPVDFSNNEQARRMVNVCWWFYMAKLTEFLDTFFLNLRKKTEQVTTLHIAHHGCTPFAVWMVLKFVPGGHSTFCPMLSSFVHMIMYFYYMIAAMGPKYQKFIWWKKYLMTFQTVQFIAMFIHQFQLLFRECDYPKYIMVWITLHAVMFYFLFSNFYKTKEASTKEKLNVDQNKRKTSTANETERPSANNENTHNDLRTRQRAGRQRVGFHWTDFNFGCFPSLDAYDDLHEHAN